VTLLADPAGRLVACGSSLLGGNAQQARSLLFYTFGTYAGLQYGEPAPEPGTSADTSTPATSLFIVDTANATSTTAENATQNGTMTTTSYPLLQLVFYGGHTVAQVFDYGIAETMANYANLSLVTQVGETPALVTAIIDGPLPMPNANIAGWQFESTTNDLGSYIYGTTQSEQNAVQQSWNVSASITGEGTIGMYAGDEEEGEGGEGGIAWDFALNGGYTHTWGSSTTASAAQSAQQTSVALVAKPSMRGVRMNPLGTFWQAGGSLSITNLKFVDAKGNVISDGSRSVSSYTPQAPIFASSTPQFGTPSKGMFVPYMVTPGDLMTYTIDGTRADGTPCGINATMAKLTNGAITDYFDTVIWPAAFEFTLESGTPKKFLKYDWSLSGVDGQAFTAVQGTVKTSSWNIQASMSAGFYWSAEGGVPLIGGIENSGSLMFAVTGGYSSSTTTTSNDGWGVTIAPINSSPPWGPPIWSADSTAAKMAQAQDPGWESRVVAAYSFVAFFLPDPPSNAPPPLCPGYWAQELIKYGNTNAGTSNPAAYLPINLDPGSGCWRITYVVLSIQTYADQNNDPPTYTYKYSDPNGRFS
jgi:hypothetical protein